MKSSIITITGMSGSGKSTAERHLCTKYGLNKVISHTTRVPREGEIHGVDYYFVTPEQFDELSAVDSGWIESVVFNNNRYGAHSSSITKASANGKPCVLVCEPNGAREVHEWCKEQGVSHLAVVLDVPQDTCVDRVLKRMSDGEVSIFTTRDRLNMLYLQESTWVERAPDYAIVLTTSGGQDAADQLYALWQEAVVDVTTLGPTPSRPCQVEVERRGLFYSLVAYGSDGTRVGPSVGQFLRFRTANQAAAELTALLNIAEVTHG